MKFIGVKMDEQCQYPSGDTLYISIKDIKRVHGIGDHLTQLQTYEGLHYYRKENVGFVILRLEKE